MQLTAILGTIAGAYGLASITSPLLQLQRMRRRGSSADVSLGSLGIAVIGSFIWLCYGLALWNMPLIVVDVGCLTTGLATILVAIRLRSRVPSSALALAPPSVDTAGMAPAWEPSQLVA